MNKIPLSIKILTASVLSLAPAFAQKVKDPADTRGPVQNTGMTVQVDHEGVQAPGYHWEKPRPKTEWKARWITSPDKAIKDSTATCLRKEITLDQAPKKVTAWISADNYLLYINGIPAGRGSADPGKDFQGGASGRRFYETRDLTPLFHQGKNAVAAELSVSNRLLMELLIEYPDGNKDILGTNVDWKGIFSPYLTVPKEPLTPGHPILVNGDGQFCVHFDKIMAGRCGIKVKGSNGARIFLFSNETASPRGRRAYQLTLRDGIQTFESRDYYALGTITVVVRNATTPVEILDVTADFLSQPVEYLGSFSCSDEALNRLYKSGRWSTQICMITHHLDSPQHQEPISDYGDYLIADLVNYTGPLHLHLPSCESIIPNNPLCSNLSSPIC